MAQSSRDFALDTVPSGISVNPWMVVLLLI
jgi:hypothetical protein